MATPLTRLYELAAEAFQVHEDSYLPDNEQRKYGYYAIDMYKAIEMVTDGERNLTAAEQSLIAFAARNAELCEILAAIHKERKA